MLNGEAIDIEDTNLSEIGSEADKACKQAAAELEVNWEGAGTTPGIEIWRIENKRNKDGTPNFGINRWPKRKYGKFYRGDSYIVLKTTQLDEDGKLMWDVFFWIGSGSTQDEYGVAAYKANELDDLLGSVPIQHREVEEHESDAFIPGCFPKSVTYMNGGIESGFRNVAEEASQQTFQKRLFRLRKQGKIVRASEVECSWKSLYHGDSFVLDVGDDIYTWFGNECSPFEKNKAATFVSELEVDRTRCKVHHDISSQELWELLEEGDYAHASEISESTSGNEAEEEKFTIKAWSIYDGTLWTKIKEVKGTLTADTLKSDRAYVIDAGKVIYVWIGADASKSESKKAMSHATNYLKVMKKPLWIGIVRVMQGQEAFCGFNRNVFGN